MSPVEIMALVGAVVVPIKLLTLFKSQKLWYEKVTKRFWGNSIITTALSLLVTIIALVFLLQELTIVQVWAVVFFAMSLITLGLAPLSKYMLKVEKKWFTETNVLKTGWVPLVVWLGLIIWVLYSLFAA